ncbi:MAG: response regulator [Alphaproteobacteria bacterium]|nr:response regulator [Alphaproteobacteria bacterium]
MQPPKFALIHLIDDDASVREALAWLLRSRGLTSMEHASADDFLAHWNGHKTRTEPCCLLLDVRMPGTSGLALFEQWISRGLIDLCPVIFLTGHADVPTAVDAVKRGAFDFCEKPFSDNTLVDRIEQALALSKQNMDQQRHAARQQQRLADLTEREHDVMTRVVQGLPNKLIADQLGISVRTVEVHRARVFEKMGVKSAVELSNLVRSGGGA